MIKVVLLLFICSWLVSVSGSMLVFMLNWPHPVPVLWVSLLAGVDGLSCIIGILAVLLNGMSKGKVSFCWDLD